MLPLPDRRGMLAAGCCSSICTARSGGLVKCQVQPLAELAAEKPLSQLVPRPLLPTPLPPTSQQKP